MRMLPIVIAACPLAGTATAGNAVRGGAPYAERCSGCHSIEANRVGPMHKGVFGRRAGSAPGFAYSPAVKGSEFVWSEATLDRWLTDPQSLIPGQRMNFRTASPEDRADIIAFLASTAAR